jgi:hypothetical protein
MRRFLGGTATEQECRECQPTDGSDSRKGDEWTGLKQKGRTDELTGEREKRGNNWGTVQRAHRSELQNYSRDSF